MLPAVSAPELDAVSVSEPLRKTGWIMGRRVDLAWVLLPVVTGWACLYAHTRLAVSSFLIWWLWSVVLNGPHFWATISRTYLDRQERRDRRALLVWSLLWLLLGPACIVASVATGSRGPFLAFWLFQITWAYFHVVRQHYGFMALYQKRNGEPEGSSNRRDYWFFHVVMFGPVAALLLQYPDLRRAFGLAARHSPFESAVIAATVPVIVAAVVLYVGTELAAFARTRRLNAPKLLLLATYVPFHTALLLYPAWTGDYDLLLVQAAFTMPHNLQYLAIVWFYNRNRFGGDVDGREYGLASVANKTVGRFAAAAVVASIALFYSRWYFEGVAVPFSLGRFAWSQATVAPGFRVADVVGALWIGVVFHHQYLDQKIWKISRDRGLNRDLKLAPAVDAR
jgi:hypothetical protein